MTVGGPPPAPLSKSLCTTSEPLTIPPRESSITASSSSSTSNRLAFSDLGRALTSLGDFATVHSLIADPKATDRLTRVPWAPGRALDATGLISTGSFETAATRR